MAGGAPAHLPPDRARPVHGRPAVRGHRSRGAMQHPTEILTKRGTASDPGKQRTCSQPLPGSRCWRRRHRLRPQREQHCNDSRAGNRKSKPPAAPNRPRPARPWPGRSDSRSDRSDPRSDLSGPDLSGPDLSRPLGQALPSEPVDRQRRRRLQYIVQRMGVLAPEVVRMPRHIRVDDLGRGGLSVGARAGRAIGYRPERDQLLTRPEPVTR